MTAGRGIIHSEMPRQDSGMLWGFQLWVNLPARDKLCAPRYQDISAESIPEVALSHGGKIRVIAGECEGERGPVTGIAIDPLYLDVSLGSDVERFIEIPEGHSACVYVFDGHLHVIGSERLTQVPRGKLAVLRGDGVLHLRPIRDEHTRRAEARSRRASNWPLLGLKGVRVGRAPRRSRYALPEAHSLI
jgi:quercetin 2,3-dioxygenase